METSELLRAQDGVICRRQVLACGDRDHDIRRRLRRREWALSTPACTSTTPGRSPGASVRGRRCSCTRRPSPATSALRALGLTRHDRDDGPIQLVVPARRRSTTRRCRHPPEHASVRRPADDQVTAVRHGRARRPRRSPGTRATRTRPSPCSPTSARVASPPPPGWPTTSRPPAAPPPGLLLAHPRRCHRRAPTRRSSVATWSASNDRTACRPRPGNGGSDPGGVAYRDVEYVGPGSVVELDGRLPTARPATGGPTSTGTSRAWRPVTSRCGRAGVRSSRGADSPLPWPGCCRPAAGAAHPGRAVPAARSVPTAASARVLSQVVAENPR